VSPARLLNRSAQGVSLFPSHGALALAAGGALPGGESTMADDEPEVYPDLANLSDEEVEAGLAKVPARELTVGWRSTQRRGAETGAPTPGGA